MARVPQKVRDLLAELAQGLPLVLGANLTGVYLYGSLTQRAFDPRSSDIDCIVVTKGLLSAAQFGRTAAWLAELGQRNPWTGQLQMSFLLRSHVLDDSGGACIFQHGQLRRCGTDGNPIIWLNVLKSGVVLYGEEPAKFVPPISRAKLESGLRTEVEYLREEICCQGPSRRSLYSYRAYAVLTLCRMLYSLGTGAVASKPAAVRWAQRRLPPQFAALAAQALAGGEPESSRKLPLRQVAKMIDLVSAQFNPAG